MKCISKGLIFSGLLLLSSVSLCGCGKDSFRIPYDAQSTIRAFNFDSNNSDNGISSFAANLCVAGDDVSVNSVDLSGTCSAGLFNITSNDTLYAKSVNVSVNPASLTKIMTAYLALKYGNLEDILTASENVELKEPGAQLCGFKEGDQLTLDQVLHGLLIYSGNDAGVMIAEYISGSTDEFAKLMNEEAKMLGATHTNFTNPHGLTDENHYTTTYDLYLIFNAAIKYEKFKDILYTSDYKTTYTDKDGNEKELRFSTTNYYTSATVKAPGNINVVGGKTGNTKAAGSCLILLSNNASGESFISVIMNASDKDTLYSQMNNLLNLIP